jgi:hypothetical protein
MDVEPDIPGTIPETDQGNAPVVPTVISAGLAAETCTERDIRTRIKISPCVLIDRNLVLLVCMAFNSVLLLHISG